MSLVGAWKTTKNLKGPTGYKKAGTFRDVSLVGIPPEDIDNIDAECLRLGLKRSTFLWDIIERNDAVAEQKYMSNFTRRIYRDIVWASPPPEGNDSFTVD